MDQKDGVGEKLGDDRTIELDFWVITAVPSGPTGRGIWKLKGGGTI